MDRALDPATTAATVARAADDLPRAASDATEDPARARESPGDLDKGRAPSAAPVGDAADEPTEVRTPG